MINLINWKGFLELRPIIQSYKMLNKNYLVFLLAISLIFNCLNLFPPAKSPSSSTTASSFSYSFNPIKTLLGTEPASKQKIKTHAPLPLRKMSTPLSQCPPGKCVD
jgi:hypothetical protein